MSATPYSVAQSAKRSEQRLDNIEQKLNSNPVLRPVMARVTAFVDEAISLYCPIVGKSYQWQYQSATGTGWTSTTLTGNKTNTLTVTASSGRNKYKYRCVVACANGNQKTSEPIMLMIVG